MDSVSTTVLIVEDDPDLLQLIALNARDRHYRAVTASGVAEAGRAIESDSLALAIVDLGLGGDSGFDVIRSIKARQPDTEIVVISASDSLASAIEAYDLHAFAFVPKPFDVDRLFTTLQRALSHRRVMLANRRLAWEQTLINDVSDDLRSLRAPEELVARVLRRLTIRLGIDATAVRLRNRKTGKYDQKIITAPDLVRSTWSLDQPLVERPSDAVLATGKAVRVDDLHRVIPPEQIAWMPLRAALSVPMFAAEDLVGVLSIGSVEPNRFDADDQRLLSVMANQIAVAVQNAELHQFVRVGKQEWEAAFDAIGDIIAVFDRDGRLLRGNAALARYLERELTALRGLTCDQVALCGGTFPDCAVGRSSGTTCLHAEVGVRGERIFSVSTCPVAAAHEEAAVVQIAKNVTQEIQNARRMRQMSDELTAANAQLVATVERLKTTQAQLLQAEKLSAIGQLVAGVAHELNNPLTSVIGYAQLLQEEFRGVPEGVDRSAADIAQDLRRIAEESERAARIVRNLLSFARRQSAARELQDVGDIVSRVLALRAYEFRLSGVDLEIDIEEGLPPVLGDAGQLQQALLNLVLNAEQAMRSRSVRRLCVGARTIVSAAAVELFVTDSGHGIPEEHLRRIFDPFFTTRSVGEGTGLGLSICYGIVRDHGGQIAVQSRVGAGTTFSLVLPAHPADGSSAPSVLVAHRDSTERDYLVAALTGWGHRTAIAENAAEVRAQLDAGVDVALVDGAMIAIDPVPWQSILDRRGSLVLLTDAAADDTGGRRPRGQARAVVRAPFELAALRTALRAVTQECV